MHDAQKKLEHELITALYAALMATSFIVDNLQFHFIGAEKKQPAKPDV